MCSETRSGSSFTRAVDVQCEARTRTPASFHSTQSKSCPKQLEQTCRPSIFIARRQARQRLTNGWSFPRFDIFSSMKPFCGNARPNAFLRASSITKAADSSELSSQLILACLAGEDPNSGNETLGNSRRVHANLVDARPRRDKKCPAVRVAEFHVSS